MPSQRHDVFRITTPLGTRECYQEAARLSGMPLHTWCREAMRKVAQEVFEEHGVKRKLPPAHPPKPKRLQPRIKVPRSPPSEPVEGEG